MSADPENMDASDPSSSSSDDSDFEEIDASTEDMDKLMALEREMQTQPAVYEKHVEYIAVLRRCKMKERLKTARHSMRGLFPLTEPLWLEWLKDELAAAKHEDELEALWELCELATQDYLSIPIWVFYLETMRDKDSEVREKTMEGVGKFRQLCERAIVACGLHISQGHRVWDVYRTFEEALLGAGWGGEKQVSTVRALYHRQLQVPLASGPSTLAEYKAWEAIVGGDTVYALPATVRSGYDEAQQAVAVRVPFEEALRPDKPADQDLLATFLAYVKLEETQGRVPQVQCIFERALARFPVTHHLWMQYGRYAEAQIKAPDVIRSIYSRSVRNCPWMGALWARLLRCMEAGGASQEEQAAVYQRALSAGLTGEQDYMEVLLARLDSLRRCGRAALAELRTSFQAATELMASYFPTYVDRELRLTAYWATCELDLGEDVAAARAIWEAALKSNAGSYAETWAGYIAMEEERRHLAQARTLYRRAHARHLEAGGQVQLCNAWLRFEREHGEPATHLEACLKVEPILAAAAAAEQATAHPDAKAAVEKAPRVLSKEEALALRRAADPNYKGRVAAKPPKRKKGLGFDETQAAKRQKGDVPVPEMGAAPSGPHFESAGAQDVSMPDVPQREGAKAVPASTSGPEAGTSEGGAVLPSEEAAGEAAATQTRPAGRTSLPPQDVVRPAMQAGQEEERTAFVKNIPTHVDPAELTKLFAQDGAGGLVDVRLMKDRLTGIPRGFAYVEFDSREALLRAVARRDLKVGNRQLFIAISRPPPGAPGPNASALLTGLGGRGGRFEGGRGRGRFEGGRRGRFDGGRGGRFDGGRGGRTEGGRGGRVPGNFEGTGGEGPRRDSQFTSDRRPHLNVASSVTSLVPRTVAPSRAPAGRGGGGRGPAPTPAPAPGLAPDNEAQAPLANGHGDENKSNADFRKMLLEK